MHKFAEKYTIVEKFSGFKTAAGEKVFSNEYIQSLRDADRKKANPLNIIAQSGGQEHMLMADADIMIGGGNRGGPLQVDTKVVTPFGYRRIGDLKAGDIITGRDGCMQRVVYRKDHGLLPCYKITTIDGSSIIASYDHLWNIRRTCYASKGRHLNGRGLNEDWKVWTTQQIVDFVTRRKSGELKNGHIVIPLCEPVKFTTSQRKRTFIDPYILGALLGDGCMSESVVNQGVLRFTSADDEIVQQFADAGFDMSHYAQKTDNKAKDYTIKDYALLAELEKVGLLCKTSIDKFVPKDLLFGTVDERFALVQGLMDTDGTIDKRGHCSFSTISEQLAKDMKFLINSLGGTATISKGDAGYKKNGEYIQCNDVYNVYIKIPDSARLFRLSRKKELSTQYNGGISEYHRRIVDVEYIGEKECCCIAVNNTDSLFLAEDFIVTHNSKTFSLLMQTLYHIRHPQFNGLILRNEKPDLDGIVLESYNLYTQFGTYNRSLTDMTWNFYRGGHLKFNYYGDNYEEFVKRFQGKQFCYIGVDEITHMEYKKFKYLITCNRNAYGIPNRFWGTCNPDPDSWLRKFIDWWIDEDGYPIKERDGVIRYCFMEGDSVDTIYWGDTPHEVYLQCKGIIDKLWNEEYERLGYNKERMFVKSVTYVRATVAENIKLISSDPSYVANLAQQGEEQRMRDLEGNWNFKAMGDDMIKMEDMEKFYENPQQEGDGVSRASCDVAFTGGDNLVMWHFVGKHVKDLFVARFDSRTVIAAIKEKLAEWGVKEENFTYDLNGLGQSLKGFFPDAVPFNNCAAPFAVTTREQKGIKALYHDLKSQCAYLFYQDIKEGRLSIDPRLLEQKFSGDGYKGVPLAQILQKERKAIRRHEDSADKGFRVITKKLAKRYVGHSPDFIESLYYHEIFDLDKKRHNKPKGLWLI